MTAHAPHPRIRPYLPADETGWLRCRALSFLDTQYFDYGLASRPDPTEPSVALVAEERTLKGSYIGTCVPARDIPRYVALYRAGRLPVDRLVSGYLTLDRINAGFDELHSGRAVRQIIRFDH